MIRLFFLLFIIKITYNLFKNFNLIFFMIYFLYLIYRYYFKATRTKQNDRLASFDRSKNMFNLAKNIFVFWVNTNLTKIVNIRLPSKNIGLEYRFNKYYLFNKLSIITILKFYVHINSKLKTWIRTIYYRHSYCGFKIIVNN